MSPRIFGLDGEMSGSELHRGHRLIQIGVAVDTNPDGSHRETPDLFCSLIGWQTSDPTAPDYMVWDDRAATVHNIPLDDVLLAPPAAHVDDALHSWLTNHGVNEKRRRDTIITGYNVGAFDYPFLLDALPRSARLISRRFADLNPLCFALGATIDPPHGGTPSFNTWKRHLTRVGLDYTAATGRTQPQHDAGTDALIALAAWRHAEATLADLNRDASAHRKAERARRKTATQPPD